MRTGRQVARRFAETMLYWRGYLRAKDIVEFLGVSRRTAHSLLIEWRADGLLPPYEAYASRRILPFENFDPGERVTDLNTALSLLVDAGGRNDLPGNPFSGNAPPSGGHDLSISVKIPSGRTRGILASCIERRPVWLVYAAKSGRQQFNFHAAALIRARGRYHFRGYRSGGWDALRRPLDDRFVDVVPARAIEAQSADDDRFIDLTDDADWNNFIKSRFVLSPELTEDERICYKSEYGIAETGALIVRQRRALMPYVYQELKERRCWRRDGSSVPIWNLGPELP